jgi:hypothetical protein
VPRRQVNWYFFCNPPEDCRKIYFYGCGATGRLAKMVESSIWRPFWKKISNLEWPQFPEELCRKYQGLFVSFLAFFALIQLIDSYILFIDR